ncbi:unnamed protein product, partial [Pylaiella littoralis]
MGTVHSNFNKANFRRGIRGYRNMFASLHLEENELKKLWVEFGKIDTDNGGTVSIRELLSHCDLDFTPFAYRLFGIFDVDNSGAVDFREFVLSTWNCCTMDQDTLIRFAFDMFDRDHSGAIEATEVEGMLREIYGESFVDSPNAALTLKRVKELASRSDVKTQTKETPQAMMAKEAVQGEDGGKVYSLSFEDFREFCREHAGMLFPVFTLQRKVRSGIVSEAFWKGCYGRRNNGRPGWGKSKKREHPPRNPINLKQLSTMITLNEGSTDHVESPVTSPATATPSPAPGSLKPPTRGGIGIEGNDHTDKSLKPSPKSPATTAPEQDNGRDATSDRSSGKRRASDPQGGGGEHEKRGGDGGTARKRGSGARGVVAVDADEGSAGKDGARVEIFSGTHPEKAPRLSVQPRVSKTSRENHNVLQQPAPARNRDTVHPVTETPQQAPKPSYPVPIEAGGRGVSAWARGGEGGLSAESDLPHFHGVGGDERAAGRPKRESRVEYPLAAAKSAAAAYGLPALRETAAKKQRQSHQAHDIIAASGSSMHGGATRPSSARPTSSGGASLSRNHRRETGQAAAAASKAARSAAVVGHGGQQTRGSTTPETTRDTHD